VYSDFHPCFYLKSYPCIGCKRTLVIAHHFFSLSCNAAAATVPLFLFIVLTRSSEATTEKAACRRVIELHKGNCDLLWRNVYIKAVSLNLQFFGIPLILECRTLYVEWVNGVCGLCLACLLELLRYSKQGHRGSLLGLMPADKKASWPRNVLFYCMWRTQCGMLTTERGVPVILHVLQTCEVLPHQWLWW
jgi:hypothetical protein